MKFLVLTGLLLVLAACGTSTLPSNATFRVGLYQGGEYHDYNLHFSGLISGLESLGALSDADLLHIAPGMTVREIWEALPSGDEPGICFVRDGFWDAEWNEAARGPITEEIMNRTGEGGDLDMMIGMGTWAGQDLAENLRECPVMVMSASDPVEAGIVMDYEFSGRSNVHAVTDPGRYVRRLLSFYRITEFESLGLVYEDTPTGRIYANLEDYRRVAEDRGFRIVERFISDTELGGRQGAESLAVIYSEMAPEIDALAFTALDSEQPEYFPIFMPVLLEEGILTLAQLGDPQVARGALVGFAERDYRDIGLFYAETMIDILAGTPPGEIRQVFEDPLRLSINTETARRIGWAFPEAVIGAADTVYTTIEGLE